MSVNRFDVFRAAADFEPEEDSPEMLDVSREDLTGMSQQDEASFLQRVEVVAKLTSACWKLTSPSATVATAAAPCHEDDEHKDLRIRTEIAQFRIEIHKKEKQIRWLEQQCEGKKTELFEINWGPALPRKRARSVSVEHREPDLRADERKSRKLQLGPLVGGPCDVKHWGGKTPPVEHYKMLWSADAGCLQCVRWYIEAEHMDPDEGTLHHKDWGALAWAEHAQQEKGRDNALVIAYLNGLKNA